MSDIHVHNELPELFETCEDCDGKRYLAYLEEGVPTAVWCDYCGRSGYVLTPTGNRIAQLINYLERQKVHEERSNE